MSQRKYLKISKIESSTLKGCLMTKKLDKENYSGSDYLSKFDQSSKDELTFFNEFKSRIDHQIKSNRHITINNVKALDQSLSEIREKAKELTDSIINHDDYMIVEKQKIISKALKKIHNYHQEVYQLESDALEDRVYSIENLHNHLIETNLDYFNTYKLFLSGTIDNVHLNYDFLKQKNEQFNYIIEKHFKEVTSSFKTLDEKINDIDEDIKVLIETKSFREDVLDEFFNIEIQNLLESQYNFCINEDPYSDDIAHLTEQKKEQFSQFKQFIERQENRLIQNYKDEIEEAFKRYYHQKYNQNHQQLQSEKFAKRKIKPLLKEKMNIIYDFKKANHITKMSLKLALDLYLNFYKTDPFLAQIYFDQGSRVISKEVDFTRLYKLNKSLKYQIYYTHKLTEMNFNITLSEHQFVHHLKNQFLSQEIDIINMIKDIKVFFIEHQSSIDASQIALKRDKLYILFLNDLVNAYIDCQIKKESINRQFLSEFTQIANRNVHTKADYDIALIDKTSDILLAVKESQIDTMHFKHLYENEKRMLLIQQNRLESENHINYDLLVTTLKNQMRFAKDQIILAEEEFKLRLSAIVHNIDSERIHYYDMITHEVELKEESAQSEFSSYQKNVYDLIAEIEHAKDQKLINKLEKELTQVKETYRKHINDILYRFQHNERIVLYKKRLNELDMYLEDAYLSASKLRDATITEMDEIYRYAEAKLSELENNVDPHAYPLDDILYESLQESKKRLNEKLKYAELTLEHKIENSIEVYKKAYFETNIKYDSQEILDLLDVYQNDLTMVNHQYHQTLDKINVNYSLRTESFNNEILALQQQYQFKINQVIDTKNTIIKQKNDEINKRDIQFNKDVVLLKKKHQNHLNELLEEYLKNIDDNQKFNHRLDHQYRKLTNQYNPYIKYSRKSKNIRKIYKHVLKKNKIESKDIVKQIKKDIKHLQLF